MKKVRDGYKMTELGEIPSEWEVKKLKELLDVLKDGTHNPPKRTEEGIPLLSAENIFNGKINYGINEKCISEEDYELMHKNYSIEKDDILMTIVGTIGRVAVVKDNKKFAVQRSVAILRSNKKVNNLFLTQFLSSTICKKELDRKSNSTAQAGLYLGELGKINIIVPSIKEQEKIASILSTVDEQIDNVDALIKKNKELKKGLMQTLLTKGIGHTKFKKTEIGEIPEEWEVIKLNKCGYIFGGNAFKSSSFTTEYKDNNYQVIRMGNVQLGKLDLEKNPVFLSENLVGEKEKKYLLKETDILISLTGTVNKTDYGNISWVDKNNKYLLNQRIGCLRNDNREFNNRYYYYLLQSNMFRNQFFECGVGGTGNQANVSIADLNNIKVLKLPIIEQEKIASILLEVDSKIEKHQSKKQRLEELKKGLMQQLLTGKIRL